MDSDFEEECRVIADRRAANGAPTLDHDLPNFIFTASHNRMNFFCIMFSIKFVKNINF